MFNFSIGLSTTTGTKDLPSPRAGLIMLAADLLRALLSLLHPL